MRKFTSTKVGAQGVLIQVYVINFTIPQMMFTKTKNKGLISDKVINSSSLLLFKPVYSGE